MKKNILDLRFGKLKVIEEHSKTRNGHIRYKCICDCGNIANILGTHLIQGNSKSCGCSVPTGRNHKQWNGFGEISGGFWYDHIIKSSLGTKSRRAIEVLIDVEYGWNLFLKQDKKCALSGEILFFPKKHKDKFWTASLDRIDSLKGYIEGNVQWVHKDINMMKRIYNNNYFIQTCIKIAKFAGGQCEMPIFTN